MYCLEMLLTILRYTDIILVKGGIAMSINEILEQKNITKYRLWKESGVPQATISDICTGKTRIEKCSAETIYRIAKVLDVSMERKCRKEKDKKFCLDETKRKMARYACSGSFARILLRTKLRGLITTPPKYRSKVKNLTLESRLNPVF